MRSFVKLLALGTVLMLGTVYSAGLAADKEQVIKDRQAFMKDQGRQWLVLRNYTQGKADQAAALSAVVSLTKSVPKVPDHFPPDTGGPAPGGKWGTKPEVWSEHDKFLAADKKVAAQVQRSMPRSRAVTRPRLPLHSRISTSATRATRTSAPNCNKRGRRRAAGGGAGGCRRD